MSRTPAGAKPIKDSTPIAAYQRGRWAGLAKLQSLRDAYNKAFATIRERAERAEAAQGLGMCRDCRFFEAHTTHWGFCHMEKAMANHPGWPTPWAQIQRPDWKSEPKLSVSNLFGCVLFSVRK